MNTLIIEPSQSQWPDLIKRPVIDAENLEETVAGIINTVKQSGDDAVKNYSLQFHGFAPDNLWVSEDEIKHASKSLNKDLKKAIHLAKNNIEKFHQHQIEKVKRLKLFPVLHAGAKVCALKRLVYISPAGVLLYFLHY